MRVESLTGPVILSLIIATVFQLIPTSGVWIFWRPNFLLLVVIAWILYIPDRFGIGFAAMVGLLADPYIHNNYLCRIDSGNALFNLGCAVCPELQSNRGSLCCAKLADCRFTHLPGTS